MRHPLLHMSGLRQSYCRRPGRKHVLAGFLQQCKWEQKMDAGHPRGPQCSCDISSQLLNLGPSCFSKSPWQAESLWIPSNK